MEHFVQWFRLASPYINAHRGKTFVVLFSGEAIKADLFSGLIHDFALLHSLGIRLVLVHGARPQVEGRLREVGREMRYVNGLRLTDGDDLPYVKQAIGRVRICVEAQLSMGLANSPMHGARLRVVSGNLITARPLGVREGVDYGFTGEVRRIDDRAIRLWLDQDAIVLLSPLGYSPTGEIFNLRAEEVATASAAALRADKLLVLSESSVPHDRDGRSIRELSPSDAERLLAERDDLSEETVRYLQQALRACRAGVRRTHLIERRVDGALLLELFTRDGIGTFSRRHRYVGDRRYLRRVATRYHRRRRWSLGADPTAGGRWHPGTAFAGAVGNGNRAICSAGTRWHQYRLYGALSISRGAAGRTGLRCHAPELPQQRPRRNAAALY